MIELSEKTVVEARPSDKYGPYMAIGRKMPGTWIRWILLSPDVIHPHLCEDVHRRVQQRSEERFHVHTNLHVLVSKYRGHTYVGYHRLDQDGQVIPDKGINLNVDEWEALRKHLPALRTALKQTETPPPPPQGKTTLNLFIIIFSLLAV